MSLTDAQVAEIAGMTAGTSLGVRARELAREVQELRHLRDNVLPDLRQELDVANAHLADYRKLIADLRALHKDRRHQFGWVRCAECQHTYPCPTIRLIEGAGL